MKLSELYKKAISAGIDNDPRGRDSVVRELEQAKKRYFDLKPRDKETFDIESLENPYSDSRILFGNGDEEINSIMIGIDIDAGEILLAETLRGRNRKIDLLLSHHPGGGAFGNLFSVMYMQAEILQRFGVPVNIAEALIEGRVKEVERRLMPANHARSEDAARLLNLPFMCLHTPADNMVAKSDRTFSTTKNLTGWMISSTSCVKSLNSGPLRNIMPDRASCWARTRERQGRSS